jgi:hypothetical protein
VVTYTKNLMYQTYKNLLDTKNCISDAALQLATKWLTPVHAGELLANLTVGHFLGDAQSL